jgi:hypothetical protein
MQRLKGRSPKQLTLYLRREGSDLLVPQGSEGTLLQALADLLLGALAGKVEERESAMGGVDELESDG